MERSLQAELISLPSFEHRVGRHCGSTSLQDMVNFGGWPLSEAACFGLGSGLAFYFAPPETELPTGMFMGRCRNLERNFFENCQIQYAFRTFDSFGELEAHIGQQLGMGHPVLLQGDVAGLPYYNSPMHFPGHKFVICGVESGKYLVADTAFPELQRLAPADLQASTGYESKRWPGKYAIYDIKWPLPPLTVSHAASSVQRSLIEQLNEITAADDAYFISGEQATDAWLQNIDFASAPQPRRLGLAARAFYQVIEKRGTGRGAFRGIYRDFVAELREDRLFPFPVHSQVFKKDSDYIGELDRLHEHAALSYEMLTKIAASYKMFSLRKLNATEASGRIHRQVAELWSNEMSLYRALSRLIDCMQ